ncbi:protein MEI2-like 7 [Brachypodium distachyon]|uniref:protein MEI2-like 7 n=1 Tax=Brachypodium distachyon TaxID=15368 RepID=UPI000D0D56AD|nr:protein MEI2-like 7 [Brachypodium distachyon]|eukprot:XP_024316479.1 protein MEI2-like 7 [Brachypodium distachyon]
MAAPTTRKLRADARPYLAPPRPIQLSRLPPPRMAPRARYPAASALPFPVVPATYRYCAPAFRVAASAPRPAAYGFIQPGLLLFKQPANLLALSPPPPLKFSSNNKAVDSSTSTAQASGPNAPSPPVQASNSLPVRPLSPEALPVPDGSSPPHKLISPACAGVEDDAKQLQRQTAAASASAKPPMVRRGRQVVGPGISTLRERSPGPVFTTPARLPVPAPLWRDRHLTTVMIRNIPNKLTPADLILLVDDHCARVNKKNKERGAPLAAYDFLYLRMDFSLKSSNMGYAFVNLTTKEADLGLHRALQGATWKVRASKKVVHICPAHIQGKKALVKHFSRSVFPCLTAEFLPAVFTPPRDGAADTSSSTCYVGYLVGPRPPRTPRPAPPMHVWKLKLAGNSAQEQEAERPAASELQAWPCSQLAVCGSFLGL